MLTRKEVLRVNVACCSHDASRNVSRPVNDTLGQAEVRHLRVQILFNKMAVSKPSEPSSTHKGDPCISNLNSGGHEHIQRGCEQGGEGCLGPMLA